LLAGLMVVTAEPASPKLAGFGQSEGGPAAAHGVGRSGPAGHLELRHDDAARAFARSRREGRVHGEEAAAYERQVLDRQAVTNNTAGPDWWDPGTRHLANRRTSLVDDPTNGRLPALTPEAQARAAARTQARRERGIADGPEDLALNERCLQWSTAGPPMLPGVYNNNVQFLQTRDAVVILNEMIHDARIVPMDGRPHGVVPRWMGDARGRWEGRDPRRRHGRPGRQGELPGIRRSLPPGRALHARGCRYDRVSIHRRGSHRLDAVVERVVPDDQERRTAVRIRVPRGNARSMEGILKGARTQDTIR
jgi:hypothetical protein